VKGIRPLGSGMGQIGTREKIFKFKQNFEFYIWKAAL
jgi:hypothetical protein